MIALRPGADPKPRKAVKRRGHKDPVTPELADYLWRRDGRCAMRLIEPLHVCDGPSEIDHILNSGKGKRGPSTARNCVVLCRLHHRAKTEHANYFRPLLLAYVSLKEDGR